MTRKNLSELQPSDIVPGTLVVWKISNRIRGFDLIIGTNNDDPGSFLSLECRYDGCQCYDKQFEVFIFHSLWSCITHMIMHTGEVYDNEAK